MSDAYYRPTEKEMLEEYLKVIDALTINDEFRFSRQIQDLQNKNQDNDYIIKGKLQEKEDEIIELKQKYEEVNNNLLEIEDHEQNFRKQMNEILIKLNSKEEIEL